MKICTIIGTRPEIIRLSCIIKKLDSLCEHSMIYTGQNSDPNLSDIFFKDLGLRQPDYWYRPTSTIFYEQIGEIFINVVNKVKEISPDKVLILGDTNSCLIALMIERLGIPVYHMEAGNRCFDLRVPEEINRRAIDHSCSFNLPYTHRSMHNLLAEGIHQSKIFVCGNPIFEVMLSNGLVLDNNNISKSNNCLMTLHRSENMVHMQEIINTISENYNGKIIFPMHPKTKDNIKFKMPSNIEILPPVSFTKMLSFYNNCDFIITDSGTVQEEACIIRKKCVIVRASTERPEIIEQGGTVVCGRDKSDIKRAINIINRPVSISVPDEYLKTNVSDIVVNILLGGAV